MSDSNESNVLDGVEGAVARLTLNRPNARNAISLAFMKDFRDAVAGLAGSGVRAVVITGAGVAVNPVGQTVGLMREVRSCRELIYELVEGFMEAAERLAILQPR